jgi:arginine/lysine/ornithine decarboxylase
VEYLYNRLLSYSEKDMLPMHMPGHKRNAKYSMVNPYSFDITEVPGVDSLHNAKDVILNSMQRTARLFESEKTYYLVNGSTGGNLSAIFACTSKKGTVVIARNCHKSVYHACSLRQCKIRYIWPEILPDTGIFGPVTLSRIKEAVEAEKEVQCVVLTSPTYEGIVSPIHEIAEYLHVKKIPLIVDEAHGAHLVFHPSFPESAICAGADLVIQSTHKLLPALTQTGLLHCNGDLVDRERVAKYLTIFQTSSPSYVLMASIDQCTDYLISQGKDIWNIYVERLQEFCHRMESLKHLYLLQDDCKDSSKLVICTDKAGISGMDLDCRLRKEFHIQVEMASGAYVIAMTSVADEQETFLRLGDALLAIDGECIASSISNEFSLPRPNGGLDYLEEIDAKKTTTVLLADSVGKKAAEYLYLYPPGVPVLVPGEVITKEIVSYCNLYEELGYEVHGLYLPGPQIKTWADDCLEMR